jgi:dipeptidyl aminopeptidase/acylaminoacyl peptidase
MHFISKLHFLKILGVFLLVALTPVYISMPVASAKGDKVMSVTDIMKFREIKDTKISDNGMWVAYSAQPDRGAITGYVQSSDGKVTYGVVEGTKPVFSSNNLWVMFTKPPSMLTKKSTKEADRKKLKNGLVVINLETGEKYNHLRVKSAQFSGDSSHIGILFEGPEKKKDDKKAEAKDEDKDAVEHYLAPKMVGTILEILQLATDNIIRVENVQKFAFGENGPNLAYSVINKGGRDNKMVARNLNTGSINVLDEGGFASFPHMAWDEAGDSLAYLKGSYLDKSKSREHALYFFKKGSNGRTQAKTARNDWFISHDNKLTWSKDGQRLFFGQKPVVKEAENVDTKIATYDDLFNVEKLRAAKELQVWHGDDPRIKPQEKVEYKRDLKKFYTQVYHLKQNKFVALTDEKMSTLVTNDNGIGAIGYDPTPYLKEMTWDGSYNDAYWVNLKTGKRKVFSKRLARSRNISLSSTGRYVAFYNDQAYWLFDSRKGSWVNLTKNITVPIGNELHDYPSDVPGYGIAGWMEKDNGVLIYDRYDIWLANTKGETQNLTNSEGRINRIIFRLVKTDVDQQFYKADDYQLMHAYNDMNKEHGFYHTTLSGGGMERIVWGKKTFKFVAKAKKAGTILFTRESLKEFPDLWVGTADKSSVLDVRSKLTDVNPQLADFAIGEPMLVNWRSTYGKDLQGVLIKPANYVEGKRYPVLVYYYRYFSQRMYNFNQMKINHRPNFPYYTSNGYAVFLPDIIFKEGMPGPSATAALVPGIEKIVELGIADREKIGLHGHSWSGYQTAYVVTQTDIFAAAVSGAPVSNMTSAYTGIRLGSGRARQFQYEQSQSRIGATLYDKPHLYIENSPIFFVDRINTPMLIQHGDADDAVPWGQSIEMYLAMRRLGKDVVFLQYEGEPHHLKKYPNKLDYTLKMKHYFDHYLKGVPAEDWITKGESYSKPDPEKAQK